MVRLGFCASPAWRRAGGAARPRACRRPRPRMCAADDGAPARPEIVKVVERTSRGHRLYVTDMSESECDVFEDFRTPPGAPAAAPGAGSRTGPDPAPGGGGEALGGVWWASPPGRLFQSVMLPAGYPTTVSPEFFKYMWCVIGRNGFRKANYVLGTSTLLYALGLSAGDSLSVSVALNWLLKDGLGLVTKVSASSAIASQVDRDPKFWRMCGDTLMVLSVLVELVSPIRPALFLIWGSISSLLREVADAMSGPSYRVFLQSIAIDENIGDVSSRSEIHVVVGTIVGLAVGALTTAFESSPQFRALGISRYEYQAVGFALFSLGHLSCTFSEVSTVALRSLNRKRLSLITEEYVRTGKVPSVVDVNKRERLLPDFSDNRIVVGAQLLDFIECGADVRRAMTQRKSGSMVAFSKDGAKVGIMLEENVSSRDTLRGFLQAQKLIHLASVSESGSIVSKDSDDVAARERAGVLVEASDEWAATEFANFEEGLAKKGWSQRLLLDTGSARFREGLSSVPDVLKTMNRQVKNLTKKD